MEAVRIRWDTASEEQRERAFWCGNVGYLSISGGGFVSNFLLPLGIARLEKRFIDHIINHPEDPDLPKAIQRSLLPPESKRNLLYNLTHR